MSDLYCPQHRRVEHLTAREVEDLVYGLIGELADEKSDPEPTFESSDDFISAWCPRDHLDQLRNAEMYLEHIESLVEARRAVS